MLNEKLKKQIKQFGASVPKNLKPLIKEINSTYDELDDLRKYKEIFQLSPEAIVVLDKKGVMIDANNRLKEWLGYDPKKIIGKHILKFPFIGKKSKLIVIKKFINRMAGKKIDPYDLIFINKKRAEVVGRVFATPIRNEKGKIIQDLVLISDVTKQKKAENKLKASEKRFEDLAKSSGDWFWEVDAKGKYTYASGKVKKILGYEPKDLLGKTPFDFMDPAEAKSIGMKFKRIIEQKLPIVDLENWNVGKDGGKVCLITNGVPILGDEGELLGYRGVDKDITERKANEKIRRKRMLDALSYSSEQLLKGAKWDDNISNIIKKIGEAANVSRVYIFKKSVNKKKQITVSQLFEWVAKGIPAQIDNKMLQDMPLVERGFGRWLTLLDEDKIISGHVKDFPKSEQMALSVGHIVSLVIVPIFVKGKWWGSIGFDECKKERGWHNSDVDILKAVANLIGSALERDITQNKLQKVNEDLIEKTKQMEQFNKLMVGREIKMIELKSEISRLNSLLDNANNN